MLGARIKVLMDDEFSMISFCFNFFNIQILPIIYKYYLICGVGNICIVTLVPEILIAEAQWNMVD